MRRAKKVMMWACCTAPAVAAMVMTGAGTAGASVLPVGPGPVHTSPFHPGPFRPIPGKPIQGNPTQGNPTQGNPTQGNPTQSCNKYQPETWNLNGRNSVDNGSVSFGVTLDQRGSCLTGYASNGAIHGTVNGSQITFSITYPPNSGQRMRTFTGTISRRGAVSGWVTGKGPRSRSGPWSLDRDARSACQQGYPGQRECEV